MMQTENQQSVCDLLMQVVNTLCTSPERASIVPEKPSKLPQTRQNDLRELVAVWTFN